MCARTSPAQLHRARARTYGMQRRGWSGKRTDGARSRARAHASSSLFARMSGYLLGRVELERPRSTPTPTPGTSAMSRSGMHEDEVETSARARRYKWPCVSYRPTPPPPPAPPAELIGLAAANSIRRARAAANDTRPSSDSGGSEASTYSHASVVSVSEALAVSDGRPRCAQALMYAVADALDMRAARATAAQAALHAVEALMGEPQRKVAEWVLRAAERRCALYEARQRFRSTPPRNLPPLQAPHEGLVRQLCTDGAMLDAQFLRAAARAVQARRPDARTVPLHMPTWLAVLGVVCAMARAECNVHRRWSRRREVLATLVGRSKAAGATVVVDLYANREAAAVVRPQRRVVRKAASCEADDDLVQEVVEVLQEFNAALQCIH